MQNAADRKSIRKAEKAARQFEANDREAVVGIMSTLPGRSWMFRRLEACHCFNDAFTGDALREAYQKGERNFGLQLLAQLMKYCPEQYIQMTREANDRYISDEREPNPDSDSTAPSEYSGSEDGNGGIEITDIGTRDLFNPNANGWNLVEGAKI